MTKISQIDFKPKLVSMMKSVLENASAYIDNESSKRATSATQAKTASRILTTSPTRALHSGEKGLCAAD